MTRISSLSNQEFARYVQKKRIARMATVDDMKPEYRSLVHEYGLNVVKTLIDLGVTKPNQIRHVVETVLDEFSPTRGSFSSQGVSTHGGS
jgi:hypothetical protein